MTKFKNCHSRNSCSRKQTKLLSWLPAIVIAILPKCPFCIMAYSGAISMCSGSKYFPNAQAYSGYIIIGLSLFILLGIILNNKGVRTWKAALIVSIGILLLTISQYMYMSEPLYYLASFILFFGIWYNGSFTYFYRRYFDKKLNQQVKL